LTGSIRNVIAGAFHSVRLLEMRQAAELQMAHNARMAALGHMVAGLAHKIGTPLGNAVLGASHMQRLLPNGTPASEALELVNSSLTRVCELVAVFKQVTAVQANEMRTRFDLRELLVAVRDNLQAQWPEKTVAMAVECPVGISMESFPDTIIRIFGILYKNAVTHGFRSSQAGKVLLTAIPLPDSSVSGWSSGMMAWGCPRKACRTCSNLFSPPWRTRAALAWDCTSPAIW
jgi:signal transduction histidine kinase